MDPNLAIVFVSMALTVAITRLTTVESLTPADISICLYFVLRRINYYIIDRKFAVVFDKIIKPGREFERIIETYLGVITLFCFLLSGFYVTETVKFYWWTCLALTFNVLWLVLVRFLIDPEKDRNPRLTVSRIYRNSLFENLVEASVCLCAALVFTIRPDHPNLPFSVVAGWTVGISLAILTFILVFDLVVHKQFLASDYSLERQ